MPYINSVVILVARLLITWPHLLAKEAGKCLLFLGQQNALLKRREIQGNRETVVFLIVSLSSIIRYSKVYES